MSLSVIQKETAYLNQVFSLSTLCHLAQITQEQCVMTNNTKYNTYSSVWTSVLVPSEIYTII